MQLTPKSGHKLIFALSIVLFLSACFRSPVPEGRVAPLATSLSLENLDGVPFEDRLVFSRINTGNITNHKVHDLVTLRIRNNGTETLTMNSLSISDTTEFTLPNNETSLTIVAGEFYDLQVKFIENAGTKGIRLQTLTLNTNDPNQPTKTVQLAGAYMTRPEGNFEITLQQVADVFGYQTDIGEPLLHNDAELKGDEVRSNFWKRADPNKSVYVRQLAAFHSCCTARDTIQITGTGGGSFRHASGYGQSLLPLKDGSAGPAEMTVNPTGNFEVKVAGYSSNINNAQNNGNLGVRFWRVKDRSGAPIPNTYFVAQDFVQSGCGSGSANCDYNDNVYLITNIAPVTPSSYRLNVGGAAYTSVAGDVFTTDAGQFSPSNAPDEPAAGPSSQAIANTQDDTLYQTYRGFIPNTALADRELVYDLPISTGTVDMRLHFVELNWDAADKRVFDVIVEGTTVLNDLDIFAEVGKFAALTKTFTDISVTDGTLTILLKTEVDYSAISAIEVVPAGSLSPEPPRITGTSPSGGATGVFRNTAIAADVYLPNVGAGVDAATLSTATVKLYKTSGGAAVPGTVNTTGGNDAIVYQPSVLLESGTNYTFEVTSGVKDQAGVSFAPYTMSFKTGSATSVGVDPDVSFSKTSVYSGSPISTVVIGPDGKLYGAGLDGVLHRWQINGNGELKAEQTFHGLSGKAVVGMAFDPNDTKIIYLWTTANEPLYPQPAPDFSGKLYKLRLRGINFFESDLQLYVTGLPRSAKDHLTNSVAFGPDGLLYLIQGGNTAMGAPDGAWYNRPERLLSASVLQIDPSLTSGLPVNVQTEACDEHCQGSGTSGNYDPHASNAPVKLYATGVRNAYDLVWHSNGSLYVPTNGSAAGGNTPDDPSTPENEALINVATQDDFLFKVEEGGYYGHPNPKRGEYIMNGGNPTSSVDPAEVISVGSYQGYTVDTQPDPNWRGFAYNFGRNRSPNGVIEYKSNTFGGKLQGKLLVVEYSGGDDILALPLAADGNVTASGVTQVISGLSDPLDLIEDTRNGNIYLAELIGGGTSGQIALLQPNVSVTNDAPVVEAGTDQTVSLTASASLDGTVSDDGQPNGTLTTSWTQIIGPGTVVFGDETAEDTSASFSEAGTYVLELSANDGSLIGSDRITIDVRADDPTSPNASFTFSCTNLACTFTDTSTDDGTLTTWAWDFGDGATSAAQNPSHSYSSAGTYTVSLTVTDNDNETSTIIQSVSVSTPTSGQAVSSFTLINADTEEVIGQLVDGDTIDYAAIGTSNISIRANTSPATVGSVSFVLGGSPYRVESYAPYAIEGDGGNGADYYPISPALGAGSHTLTATPYTQRSTGGSAGTALTVSFTVTDGGSTNTPPSADFSFSCTDLTCDFTDLSTDTDGTVTTWDWSFGDSAAANAQNPSHSYSAPGTYTVTLIATDNGGESNTVSKSVNVTAPNTNTPPSASFSFSCSNLTCSFTDTSTDADGSITAWNWTFGDGSSSVTQNPSHTYAAAGTYTVSLSTTDNGGETDTTSQNVIVTAPTSGQTVVSLSLINADTDQVIQQLTDGAVIDYSVLGTTSLSIRANTSPSTVGSVSFVLDDNTYRIESYPPYAIAGDAGTNSSDYYPMSPALAPGNHTLTATPYTQRSTGGTAGTALTVNFTVTEGGSTGNTPPNADFDFSCTDLTCDFTDLSTDTDGSITAWDWTFDDGASSTSQNPTHGYSVAGTYNVSLSVTDNGGETNTVSKNVNVTAPNTPTPPSASFTFSCTNLSCTFTDTSTDDGTLTTWAWDFGDGATSAAQNPSHSYSSAGTYPMTLTVTDDDNESSSTSQNVTVTAPSSGQAVSSFSLINADTEAVVGQLIEGGTIDYAALGTSNISIRANTSPNPVGSVSFVLDGNLYRVESYAPYAIEGDGGSGADFYPISPALAPGNHTLTATPYTQRSTGGTAGTALTVNFTVAEGGTASSSITWSTVASQQYDNSEAQGLALNGKLYSFGGFDSLKSCCTPTDRAYVYDPATNSWGSLASMPAMNNGVNPGGVTHAGMTTDGQDIFFAGGYIANSSGTGQVFGTKEVWRYNVGSDSYTRLSDLPVARSAGALQYLNGKLHYFGGSNQARTADVGDHYVLDLAGGSWTTAAPLPNPRHHMGSAVLGGKIYAVGGQHAHDGNSVAQSDVHAYDPATNTWTPKASLARARNHISSATFVFNNQILVLGGMISHGNHIADVSAYDPASSSWTDLTPLPASRSSGVGAAIGEDLYYTTGKGTKTTYKGVVQ